VDTAKHNCCVWIVAVRDLCKLYIALPLKIQVLLQCTLRTLVRRMTLWFCCLVHDFVAPFVSFVDSRCCTMLYSRDDSDYFVWCLCTIFLCNEPRHWKYVKEKSRSIEELSLYPFKTYQNCYLMTSHLYEPHSTCACRCQKVGLLAVKRQA